MQKFFQHSRKAQGAYNCIHCKLVEEPPLFSLELGHQHSFMSLLYLVIFCALGELELKRRKMNGLMAELETMERPNNGWSANFFFENMKIHFFFLNIWEHFIECRRLQSHSTANWLSRQNKISKSLISQGIFSKQCQKTYFFTKRKNKVDWLMRQKCDSRNIQLVFASIKRRLWYLVNTR